MADWAGHEAARLMRIIRSAGDDPEGYIAAALRKAGREGMSGGHSQFTPNDPVEVTLTQAGADILNRKGKALNDEFARRACASWRTDYREGEVIRKQFWCVMQDLSESFGAGAAMAFSDLKLFPERPKA